MSGHSLRPDPSFPLAHAFIQGKGLGTRLHGSILGPNKSQPRIYRFCRAEQNGVFRGPLGLGTENGDGWELSSQILWLASIFSVHTHYVIIVKMAAENRGSWRIRDHFSLMLDHRLYMNVSMHGKYNVLRCQP